MMVLTLDEASDGRVAVKGLNFFLITLVEVDSEDSPSSVGPRRSTMNNVAFPIAFSSTVRAEAMNSAEMSILAAEVHC